MNSLDRMIKKERKAKCKRIKKVRKARDLSRKHRKENLPLSKVISYFGLEDRANLTQFARLILKRKYAILGERPSAPTGHGAITPPPIPKRNF